jgi:hypothetical protein
MSSLSHNTSSATVLHIADISIRQDADGRYCLNDLHKAAGGEDKHLPFRFMRLEQTKEIIEEINQTPDVVSAHKVINGGRKGGTYGCKELVYSYAMWISAKFHLHVIRAYDAMVMKPVQEVPQISVNKISSEQRGELFAIVAERSGKDGKLHRQMWGKLKKRFKYASYHDLLECHFEDAKGLMQTMELKEYDQVESNENQIDLNDQLIQRILQHAPYLWNDLTRSVIPALRTLDSRLAGSVYGHLQELMTSVNILQDRISRGDLIMNPKMG